MTMHHDSAPTAPAADGPRPFPFNIWLRAVGAAVDLSHAQRSVLVHMATYATWDTGRDVRPGLDLVAANMHAATKGGVSKSIDALQAAGWLILVSPASKGRGRAAEYRLGIGEFDRFQGDDALIAWTSGKVADPATTDGQKVAIQTKKVAIQTKEGCNPDNPPLSTSQYLSSSSPAFRGFAAAAAKPQKKTTGKRDASALDDLLELNEWLVEAFGVTVVTAWDCRIDDMWSERWNWKRIYNTIAKAERAAGRTTLDAEDIPEPPAPPCAYNCDDRRMAEVAHDTRTGEVHDIDSIRIHGHVRRLLMPCPACSTQDFHDRAATLTAKANPAPEESAEDIAATIARSLPRPEDNPATVDWWRQASAAS